MSENSRMAQANERTGGRAATMAELMDPVALEARLAQARARRAEALAKRGTAGATAPEPLCKTAPPQHPVEPPPPPATPPPHVDASPAAAASRGPRRRPPLVGKRALLTALTFLVGMLGVFALSLLQPATDGERADPSTEEVQIARPAATLSALPPSLDAKAPAPPASVAASGSGVTPETGGAAPLGLGEAPAALVATVADDAPAAPEAVSPVLARDDPKPLHTVSASPERPALLSPAPDPVGTTRLAALPTPPAEAPADAQVLLRAPAAPLPPSSAAPQLNAAETTAPAVDAGTEPAAATEDPARSAASVFVHYPPGAADAASAAVEALRAEGFEDARAVAVGISVSQPNIRYFHAADQEAALGVSAILSAVLDGDPPEARDFTAFRPQPQEGMIEVWLAGEAPARAPARSAPRTAETPRRVSPPAIADQREAARAGLESAVKNMLRNQLSGN